MTSGSLLQIHPRAIMSFMIIIPNGLTPQEIRVLQEYRRLSAATLTAEAIKAIRHPAGNADAALPALLAKGYLAPEGEEFAITQKGKDFLAIEATPEVSGTSQAAASAAANPHADGV